LPRLLGNEPHADHPCGNDECPSRVLAVKGTHESCDQCSLPAAVYPADQHSAMSVPQRPSLFQFMPVAQQVNRPELVGPPDRLRLTITESGHFIIWLFGH